MLVAEDTQVVVSRSHETWRGMHGMRVGMCGHELGPGQESGEGGRFVVFMHACTLLKYRLLSRQVVVLGRTNQWRSDRVGVNRRLRG